MEEEAKIKTKKEKPKPGLWALFFKWDRSKFKLLLKPITVALAILFAFFAGYSLINGGKKKEARGGGIAPPSTVYQIRNLSQEVVKGESTSGKTNAARKGNAHAAATTYSGPLLIVRENYAVPSGTMVLARLVTGASNGPVRAEVAEDLFFQGERVIESGTVLLGRGSSTEERLFIRFDKLITKEGAMRQIAAEAYDAKDKIVGLKGSKIGTEATKLAAGIGLNFVGGMTEALQESGGQNGVAVKKPSFKNALLNGATYAALDQGREIISGIKNKQPIIEVEAGKIVLVVF